jgi:hypothetical protein
MFILAFCTILIVFLIPIAVVIARCTIKIEKPRFAVLPYLWLTCLLGIGIVIESSIVLAHPRMNQSTLAMVSVTCEIWWWFISLCAIYLVPMRFCAVPLGYVAASMAILLWGAVQEDGLSSEPYCVYSLAMGICTSIASLITLAMLPKNPSRPVILGCGKHDNSEIHSLHE